MRWRNLIFGFALVAFCVLLQGMRFDESPVGITKLSAQEQFQFLNRAKRLSGAEERPNKSRPRFDESVRPASYEDVVEDQPEETDKVRLIATTDQQNSHSMRIGTVDSGSWVAPSTFQETLRFEPKLPSSARRFSQEALPARSSEGSGPDLQDRTPGRLSAESRALDSEVSRSSGSPDLTLPPNRAVNLPNTTPGSLASTTKSASRSRNPSPTQDGVKWYPVQENLEELPAPTASSVVSSSAVALPGGAINEDASPELLLQAARNAVRTRDYGAATERFLLYLKKVPSAAEVRYEFAGLLMQTGRQQAAASQFEHLLVQSPGNEKYLRSHADLLLQQNNYPRVEPILQQLLQHPDHQTQAAIELARIYSSTQRKREAIAVYEKHLQYQFPKNGEDQLKLAQLLNEINLPDRALQVLTSLESFNPLNADVRREMILASARIGDEVSTLDHVSKLQTIQPENIGLRDVLAKQLHDEGFLDVAMMVDQQILTFDPTFRDSLIRSANAQLKMYDPEAAIGTLQSYSGHQADPDFLAAQGEYHSMLGEHADAIASFQRVLAQAPNHKAREGLGYAYMRSGQFRQAAAEFSKVQCSCDPCNGSNQLYLSAQLARARALAQAGLFCEAEEVVTSVNACCELANRDQVINASLDVLSLARSYPAGIELARNALIDACGRTRRENELRAKLGLMMVRGGQYAAGLKEFEALGQFNNQLTPEQIYGTYRAHKMLGNGEAARESLFDHFGLLSSDTYLRVRVSELAMEDCDCCLALEILSHLQRLCKKNVMVANRLGEACMQCSDCQDTGRCAKYFCQVLESSPTNVQAMVGMARLNSRKGNFPQAHRYFQQALQHTPNNIGLIRETARMVNQWQGPQIANDYYNQAAQVSSGDDLFDIASASPGRIAELEQDYRSLRELNSLVATERDAKWLGEWRPLSAISAFEGLAALEPTNQDALFEVAQAHSRLNRTQCAIGAYQRILAINPCNQEARIALERNFLELRPRVNFFGDYRYERGRQDLVNIQRDTLGASVDFPLRDEDEFIRVGYQQVLYRPEGGANLTADVPFARFQYKPMWPLLTWAQLNFNSFDNGIGSRINYDAGFQYQYFENASFRGIARQQNVFENAESINQNIYRAGLELGHFWQPTQRLTIDAFYRYWRYSDDNHAHIGGLYTGYMLRPGRRQVRWLTNIHAIFFDEGTVIPNPPSLAGARHPYFSPENFGFVTGGLEWRWLTSCNTFKGANRSWLQAFAGGRIDSEGVGYVVGRGEYYNDFNNRLSFRAYTELVGSSVYDLINVGINVTRRF